MAALPPRLNLRPDDRRQSADEQKLLSTLDNLWEEGKRSRERWASVKDVERDLKMYRGEMGPKNREPLFEANFIQAFIGRMVSQLTDNRPILRVNHHKEGLRSFAQVSQKVITGEWTTARMQRQLFKLAHTAATTRSAGIYTGYDPVAKSMVLETLKLSQMAVDPAIEEAALMHQAEYVIIDRIKPCADLAARFLGRGSSVKADATISDSPDKAKARGVLSPLTDLLNGRPSSVDALQRAHVWEVLLNDRQRDPGGRAMFPGGRMILRSKDLVLWDGPNPYWDGVFPVDWYDWEVDPEHPWGSSATRQLMRLQLPFNQLMDGLIENKLLTNFITVVMDHDSVTPETLKKLQNISSSLIIRKNNRNATLAVTPPPPFGADEIALSRALFTFAQLLSGVTDVTLGESPGSLQSGQAIDGLQEGANLMTRSRASRMEDLAASVGQKLLARIYQFFPSDRVVAMAGPTDAAKDYAIKRTEFFVHDNDGTPVTPEERREVFKYVRLVVSPGSSAPGSRLNRGKAMMSLFVAGLIPGIEVLRAADFPEPQELFDQAQEEASKRSPEAQKKLQAMLAQVQ